jgi:hypothetical protein
VYGSAFSRAAEFEAERFPQDSGRMSLMDLNLQRNDLLQTASTQRRTMRLLPPGTKKTQKVGLR